MCRVLVCLLWAAVLLRVEAAFWQLLAKELHSQCLRLDAVACIGYKIQRATETNYTHEAPQMDRQVDKVLLRNFINSSHWHTEGKGRTLDSIVDVVAEVAKSSFKQYISSKGPDGSSRRKTLFLPLLLGVVLKVVGLIPMLLGKLAFIGSVAFFMSKLSLVIVAIMSLKKLFKSSWLVTHPPAGVQHYAYPYYYFTHPHEYYETYPQQYHQEYGHQESLGHQQPQSHYGYTQYYLPETYQGHTATTGRQQRGSWSGNQDISSAAGNGMIGQQGIPSFYNSARRRRRSWRDVVPLEKEVGIAHQERDEAGQRRPSQAGPST